MVAKLSGYAYSVVFEEGCMECEASYILHLRQ